MTTAKYKRKREELYEEALYVKGESTLIQILRFLWRLFTAPVVWTWRRCARLLVATWRMTKSALAWTFRKTWDATVWTVKAPFRAIHWLWNLIFGPPVRYSNPRYAEIHALIARRYRRRSRFITHFFAFVLVNTAIWIDYFSKSYVYYFDSRPFFSTPLMFTLM